MAEEEKTQLIEQLTSIESKLIKMLTPRCESLRIKSLGYVL